MNLSNDEINMFNQKIQTKNSFNGHYSISISRDPTSDFDELEEVLIFEDNDGLESKQKKVKKLHREFGHASSNNLITLLKNEKYILKVCFKLLKMLPKNVIHVICTKNPCQDLLYHCQEQHLLMTMLQWIFII